MSAYREQMRVEWADTDASGRIHHTAPLRWAEVAEHHFMRSQGVTDMGGFPRRRIEVEFFQPLFSGDLFELRFDVEELGRTSLTYAWSGVVDGAGTAFAGRSVIVHIDAGRAAPLPSKLRTTLEAVSTTAPERPVRVSP
jgi:acyl-CoA thioester hydrolase